MKRPGAVAMRPDMRIRARAQHGQELLEPPSASIMTKPPCPTCGKSVDLDRAAEAPFCSLRCRQVDLGRWLDEKYGIAVEPSEGQEEADQPGDPI